MGDLQTHINLIKDFSRWKTPKEKHKLYILSYIEWYEVSYNGSKAYISRDYAFIVSKLGFTKGTSQEFSAFIKKKVFTKYKDRRNKINNK